MQSEASGVPLFGKKSIAKGQQQSTDHHQYSPEQPWQLLDQDIMADTPAYMAHERSPWRPTKKDSTP